MPLSKAIRAEALGLKQNAESMVIEQRLNRLFYEKPDLEAELEFLNQKGRR